MAYFDVGQFYTNTKGASPGYWCIVEYDSITRSGTTVTMNNAKLVLTRNVGSYGTENRVACCVGVGGSTNNVKNNATIRAYVAGSYSGSSMSISLGSPSIYNHTSTSFEIYVAVASTGWNSGWTNFQGESPIGGTYRPAAPAAYPSFSTAPSVSNIQEHSFTLSRGATNINSKFYYKQGSNGSWVEMTTSSVTISNLSRNTKYTYYVQARNSADTSLTTTSSALTFTTVQYPYVSSITTSAMTAGGTQKVNIVNPLGRSVTLYARYNTASGTVINSTTTSTNGQVSISLPISNVGSVLGASGTSGKVFYNCTYNSTTVQSKEGTVSISAADAKPTWPSSSTKERVILYKDGNSSSYAITQNNQTLIQRWSKLYYGINFGNYPASGRYSATISSYKVSINGGSYVACSASSTASVNANLTVSSTATSIPISVKAVDSRGFESDALTYNIPVTPYIVPTATISAVREGGYGEVAILQIQPQWSIHNTRNAGSASYTISPAPLTGAATGTISSFTSGTTLSQTFDNDKIYTFSIVLTDKLGGQSVTFTTSLAEGRPIMFVDSAQTGVGVNCFPSFSGLEVNGPILSNRYAWVGQTDNTAGSNTFFKFASVTIPYTHTDYNITFKVFAGYGDGAAKLGILTAHVRTSGSGTFESGDLVWEYAGSGVGLTDFRLGYSNSSNSTNVELWVNITDAWQQLKFIVMSEGTREAQKPLWTLYQNTAAAGLSAPTAGLTYINSRLLTLLNPSPASDLLKAYPVGSIYMSTSSTSPSSLFGGSWERIKDKFLLGVGNTYGENKTGGSAAVTLKTEQIPGHSHTWSQSSCTEGGWHTHRIGGDHDAGKGSYGWSLHNNDSGAQGWCSYTTGAGSHTHTIGGSIGSTGGGQSHDNMPPYTTVYIWKRIG